MAALALAFACTAVAGVVPAEPPTSPGTVLFGDEFEGDTLSSAWQVDLPGTWSVQDGVLRAQLPDVRQQRSFAFVGSERWRDVMVEFDVCGVRGVDKGVVVRAGGAKRGVGVDLRAGLYRDVLLYRGYESWGRATAPNENGTWHHVKVQVRGNRYRVEIDGKLRLDVTDPANSCPQGRVGLAAYTGGIGVCTVLFDNFVVRAVK
jgi:hypothetical protein